MANSIVTRDFLTPSVVTATTTATGFRVGDVLLDTKIGRVHRGTSPTGQSYLFQFPTAVRPRGVLVQTENFTTCTWSAGVDTDADDDTIGARSVYFSELTQRYVGLQPLPAGTARLYYKLAVSGVLGGDGFAGLSGVTFVTEAGMVPIGYSYGWPKWGQAQKVDVLDVGSQVSVRGRPFLRLGLGQPHIRKGASEADLIFHRNLVATAKHTPHLFSTNRPADLDGDGTCKRAWLMVVEGEEQSHDETMVTFSPDTMVVREVIE